MGRDPRRWPRDRGHEPVAVTQHRELLAAGLQGKAKAVTPDGGPDRGEFVVTIGTKPPQTCVSPSGEVVQGKCQLSGG